MLIFVTLNIMFSYLNNLLCNFSLIQVVPSFTHVSTNGSQTLIDLALLADVLSFRTVPLFLHCHHPTTSECHSLLNGEHVRRIPTLIAGAYGSLKMLTFQGLIQQTDWDSLLSDNIDLSTRIWTQKFIEIIEECIPQHDLASRKRNLPWLTKNIARHMRKRNSLFQRAKQSSDSVQENS